MKRLRPIPVALLFAILYLSPVRGEDPIWAQDFSGQGVLDIWDNLDQSASGDNAITWQYCDQPGQCPPELLNGMNVTGYQPFISPTSSSGYIYASFAGNPNPGSIHLLQLTTDLIDCSDLESVYLQFYTRIATYSIAPLENAKLMIFSDGDWHPITIFPALECDEEIMEETYIVSLDISEYAVGQEIQIRWQWTGKDELFWIIDDVTLTESDPAAPPQTVWFERFNDGYQGWELNSVEPDNTAWEWNPAGDVSSGVLAKKEDYIRSVSASDGAMVFNADYYSTGGTEVISPPYPTYISELISPTIDLSGIEQPLFLQFTQFVRLFGPAPGAPQNSEGFPLITSVSVSTDNGMTYGDPIELNTMLGNQIRNQSTERIPLPAIQGEPEVKIKFTWAGNFFFWVLDDIGIALRPEYDLKVNRNFFAIMPNAMTPQSQLEEEAFLADITNIGTQAAQNAYIDLTITRDADAVVVYQDTNFFGPVAPDAIIENVVFGEKLNSQDISQTGNYTGRYLVQQDSTDVFPDDNAITWAFQVTDTTFAKELGFTRNVTAQDYPSFSYGNCFFIPNGLGRLAKSVTFGVANANELAGKSVTIYLHEWEGDLNDDQIANSDEYTTVAFNNYQFNGSESNQLITVPVDVDGTYALKDSTYYIAAVQYVSQGGQRCFFLASDEFDYQATWFVTDSLDRPQYASLVDLGNTENYSLLGFGLDIVPSIRLHIDQVSHSEYLPEERPQVRIFPNPAGQQFTLDFSLDRPVKEVEVIIQDATGKRMVHRVYPEHLKTSPLHFDTRFWPEGVYFIELITDAGRKTEKLIVQHH